MTHCCPVSASGALRPEQWCCKITHPISLCCYSATRDNFPLASHPKPLHFACAGTVLFCGAARHRFHNFHRIVNLWVENKARYWSTCRLTGSINVGYVYSHSQDPAGLTSVTLLYSGWLADTFLNSDDAEVDLCADRSGFLRSGRKEIVPHHIWRYIAHSGADGYIEGFRRLFDHMNMEATADDLRQLVVDHFNSTPYLQKHLSTSSIHCTPFTSLRRHMHLKISRIS